MSLRRRAAFSQPANRETRTCEIESAVLFLLSFQFGSVGGDTGRHDAIRWGSLLYCRYDRRKACCWAVRRPPVHNRLALLTGTVHDGRQYEYMAVYPRLKDPVPPSDSGRLQARQRPEMGTVTFCRPVSVNSSAVWDSHIPIVRQGREIGTVTFQSAEGDRDSHFCIRRSHACLLLAFQVIFEQGAPGVHPNPKFENQELWRRFPPPNNLGIRFLNSSKRARVVLRPRGESASRIDEGFSTHPKKGTTVA